MEISYKISHGVGDWYCIDPRCDDLLTIYLEPKISGTLVMGRARYEIRCGEVTLSVTALTDGAYYPRVEHKDGIVSLPPMMKRGCEIYPMESDRETLCRLVENNYDIEQRLYALESDVTKLIHLCVGHDIFNTERKEI